MIQAEGTEKRWYVLTTCDGLCLTSDEVEKRKEGKTCQDALHLWRHLSWINI